MLFFFLCEVGNVCNAARFGKDPFETLLMLKNSHGIRTSTFCQKAHGISLFPQYLKMITLFRPFQLEPI